MKIGDNLKRLRNISELDRKSAAKQLGISVQALGYYENDKREPPFEVLEKMKDLYQASFSSMFGEETLSENVKKGLIEHTVDMLIDEGFFNGEYFEDQTKETQQVIIAAINALVKNKNSAN